MTKKEQKKLKTPDCRPLWLDRGFEAMVDQKWINMETIRIQEEINRFENDAAALLRKEIV